ncbi:MAG: pyrroloquinoline quinone-dependent dehydrogenase [Parvularculaceae bacterium]|nr:pyrroloquinoline quinone-dependent dehydrogenase [Parvularculaceae bacterium]
MLGGAHGLDIKGAAKPVAAAPSTPPWSHYGADAGGSRFSGLDQITRENVAALTRAWVYSSGDLKSKPQSALLDSAGEATPILVEDSLVYCTPFNEVIALDPGTGAEKWRHDPKINLEQRPANQYVCRGVAYWKDDAASGLCASRVFTGTNDGRLVALDAKTGAPCADFGDAGTVAIDPGMDLVWPGEFQITSAPTIAGEIVVVGSSISDNARVAAPKGTVRAYDVRTGALRWTFDPIPRTADAPNAGDWKGDFPRAEGHANAWAPMSYDEGRGLLFVPTSSPSPDFFGGLRPGDNRYANSIVALNAPTGAVVWSFQTVHHDVWDYDVPAQPALLTILKDGAPKDVVALAAKTGLLFVLDRDTGEPVLPVEERPVPQDGAPGEALSPTQPFPTATPPIVPNTVDPKKAFGLTLFDRSACKKAIKSLRADGLFTPPTLGGTLFLPFTGGGGNWGGGAFDPSRNLFVVNMSNVAHRIELIPAEDVEAVQEAFHDSEVSPQRGAPYGMRRDLLVSPLDLPCTPPPWGVLAAVDLQTGEIVWRRTLGTIEDLTGGVLKSELGTPTIGGPMATAGGLVFIGATLDYYLRAFDIETGKELWKGRLPTNAPATPMTYEWRGRQYVVVMAGGYSNIDTPPGDELIAFALPE